MLEKNFYNSMRIFIASPGDVKKERQIAEEVIKEVDKVCRSTFGLRAECLRWEDMAPMTPQADEGQIEDVIIRDMIQKCNVFVLILNKRYGSVSEGYSESNTEREINAALDIIYKKKSNLTLLSYFKSLPDNPDPGEQEKKVRELRKKLSEQNIFFQDYKNADDFKQRLTHHLYYVAIRFEMAITKQRSLRAFWNLGNLEEKGIPRIAVIYPALNRREMKYQKPDRIWLERLVPNVVFEDFKAINKVEKTLRLIGNHSIETHTTKSVPHEIYDMNRVWVCLPRNTPGLKQMENYQSEARFKFIPREPEQEGSIEWHPRHKKSIITVHSPLSKYLEIQRYRSPGGEWSSSHANIFARDYAILARFSDKRESNLKDYFIAGIRGLGTWGAGWFIDRRFRNFLKWEDQTDLPIQILLEVTYKNENIHEVRDVSDEPASYFDQQNDPGEIERIIKSEC